MPALALASLVQPSEAHCHAEDAAPYAAHPWAFQGAQLCARGSRAAPRVWSSFAPQDTCEEGFRCVSRISKFGKGHFGKVDTGKEKIDDEENSPPVYEWGCPYKGDWSESRFESGPRDDQCTEDGDCLCIARGSPDMHTEVEKGRERIVGKFVTQSSRDDLTHEPRQVIVLPHYMMRNKDGAPFDVDNPHSGLGTVKEFDRDEWLRQYKDQAPLIQNALDRLRASIDAQYQSKIQDGGAFICDGAQAEGTEPSLSTADNQLAQIRIRRFQVLKNDCGTMRDTASKLSGRPEEETFAASGKADNGDELKCYKKKDSKECQQLNCYSGFDDQGFLDRLQSFKTQLDACVPEQDLPVKELPQDGEAGAAGAAGQEAAAAEAAAAEAGAPAAEGQEAAAAGAGAEAPAGAAGVGGDTAEQSLGAMGLALGAVLGSRRRHARAAVGAAADRGARCGRMFL